jgi:hypothetical protein
MSIINSSSIVVKIDNTFNIIIYKHLLLLVSIHPYKIFFIKFLCNELSVFIDKSYLLCFLSFSKFNHFNQYKMIIDIFGIDRIKYHHI